MPIFEHEGKQYRVAEEHIEKFASSHPGATTIMERDGKKYRVRASDYNAFIGKTGQNTPATPSQTKPPEDITPPAQSQDSAAVQPVTPAVTPTDTAAVQPQPQTDETQETEPQREGTGSGGMQLTIPKIPKLTIPADQLQPDSVPVSDEEKAKYSDMAERVLQSAGNSVRSVQGATEDAARALGGLSDADKAKFSREADQVAQQVTNDVASFNRKVDAVKEYNDLGKYGVQETTPTVDLEGNAHRTYITPLGNKYTDRRAALVETSYYLRPRSYMSLSTKALKERQRIQELYNKRLQEIITEQAAQLGGITDPQTLIGLKDTDPQIAAYKTAMHQIDEQLKQMNHERRRNHGQTNFEKFWGAEWDEMSDGRKWDGGIGDLRDALTMLSSDYYLKNSNPEIRQAGETMLRQIYNTQEIESLYGSNEGKAERWGGIMGSAIPFVAEFMLTRGGFSGITAGTKAGASVATKAFGEQLKKEMVELGIKAFVKKYGAKGALQGAGDWAIKAVGATANDFLRGFTMANTIHLGHTAADAIGYKLGSVEAKEDGTLGFQNPKSWGGAIWLAEADNTVENASEMFGEHIDPLLKAASLSKLSNVFGLKSASRVLSGTNARNFDAVLGRFDKYLEKAGVSGYVGECLEEYDGQGWRSLLNLDTAYRQNEDGTRTNLFLTGEFHGDIWGGMFFSVGLTTAAKYAFAGAAAYSGSRTPTSTGTSTGTSTEGNNRPSGSVGSSYYTAFRHLVEKTAVAAKAMFGDNWEQLQSIIDNTPNDAMGSFAESLMRDHNMSDSERSAIMNYIKASLIFRGFNMATAAAAAAADEQSGEFTPEETAQPGQPQLAGEGQNRLLIAGPRQDTEEPGVNVVNGQMGESYIEGYNISEEEQNGINNAYILHRQKIADTFGEEMAELSDGELLDTMRGCYTRAKAAPDSATAGLLLENAAIIADYLNARSAYKGMIQGVRDKMDLQVAQSDALVDVQTNKATGQLHGATLRIGDEHVYIIDGNVAVLEDGTIDTSNSDKTLVIRHEDGKLEMVSTDVLLSVDEPVDAITAKQMAADTIRQQYAQTAADIIDGTITQFNAGDTYILTDDQGNSIQITLAADQNGNVVNPDGTINAMNQDGQPMRITQEMIQQAADQQHSTEAQQMEDERQSQIAELLPAHLDLMSSEQQEQAPQASAEQQPQSALSQIPKDEETGEPLYEQAEPDTAWDAVVEQAEGDEEVAQSAVESMLADKEAALKKLEKKKPKTGVSMSEKIAAEKEHKAEVDKARADVAQWKKISQTRFRRQAAIDEKLRLEAAAAAAARKSEEERHEAERKEAERKEREALNGVPDMVYDKPTDARARGYRRLNGHKIDRQQPLEAQQGKQVNVKFSNKETASGHVALIDAGQLQPSHMDGQRNPLHFIDEAQPKERNDSDSTMAASDIASGIRPDEITSSVTAYTGAPSINARGEVIQGNNRSAALREMWESHPEQAALYKQYLIDHASEFGLTPEQIESMEHPVLVNMLDVDDNEAIRLGQFVAQDTESGGVERLKPKHIVKRMGKEMATFADLLLRSSEEDASFSELVDRNGDMVIKWLAQYGYITNTQARSAYDSRGNLTAEAKNDLKGIMYQAIFEGGSTRLEEMFNHLPVKAQRAILATAFRDYDSPESERMIPEIQDSIMAFSELLGYQPFALAKNAKEALVAVEEWKIQYKFDDSTGEPYLPAERFSNFALHLAMMYKGETQSFIQATFNRLYDLIQGTQEENLFEQPDNTPRTLAQAIKEELNIDYNGKVRGNVLVSNPATSAGRERGGAESPSAGERVQDGEQPAERPGRTEGVRGESGEVESSAEDEGSGLFTEEEQTEGESSQEPTTSRQIEQTGREVDTNPTEAQKKAGNYKKGHVKVDGHDVTIENPKGSIRSGRDANGKSWQNVMNNTYGYIRGTESVDGDHIDVFLSDKPEEGDVWVIDQVDPKTGAFDEHKVMYGFSSEEEARKAYLSNYSPGWKGLGAITHVSKDEFKKWIDSSHRKTKPFAEYKSVKNKETLSVQGLEGYTQSEIKDIARVYIEQRLNENGFSANVEGIEIHGSRARGNARDDSDLDIVVEYSGDEREDDMFNLLNDGDEALNIEGIRVDINPIRAQETGTLDKYMERSRKYDEEVLKNENAETTEIKPVGRGVFGDIYDQFRGKAKEAIAFLMKKKGGEATAALHHKDIGDIGLVWGNKDAGLEKISKKHPEVLDDLQGVIDGMRVTQSSDNRIVLESDTHKAVVSKKLRNKNTPQWLLTAYEKKDASGGSSDIVPEPVKGKQNGTAPLQSTNSAGKGNEKTPGAQGNRKENATEAEKQNGLHEEWHDNGQLKCRVNYKDGEKNGVYEEWHSNGQLLERSHYKNDKLDGLCEIWDKNGQLRIRENYKNGKPNGLCEEWYSNGKPRSRINYKNGKREGLCERWGSDGTLEERANYKKGKLDGPRETWFSNGKPKVRSFYINGALVSEEEWQRHVAEEEKASGENYDPVWDRRNKRTSAVLDSAERVVTQGKEHPDERERAWRDMEESIKALSDLELDLMIRNDKVEERYPVLVDWLRFERRKRNKAAEIETNKSNIQYVDGLLESQVLVPSVYKPKKFDIFGYASRDEKRPVMNGVHHGDGYAVASDGYILVADKQSYDKKLEGKTVDKKGKEIEGKYPDWKGVLPKDTAKVTNGESVVAMRLNAIWEKVTAEWKAAKARGEKVGALRDFAENALVFLRTPDGFFPMKLGTLTRIVDASERLGNHDLLLDEKRGFVMSEGRNGYALGRSIAVDGKLDGNSESANMRFAIDLRDGTNETQRPQLDVDTKERGAMSREQRGAYDAVREMLGDSGEGIARDPSALTKEESDIVAAAKRNGTYMKAPNGKPTNLTEKQWAQVRTKAFKEWFGDWEKPARIEKLRRSEPVVVSGEEYKGKYELNRDSAKSWIMESLRGKTFSIRDTGEEVTITRVGANKVTSHSAGNEAHLKSIASIPQLIENAIFIDEFPNEKENDKYDNYRYYVCGLKIGGVDYTAKITIGVKQGKKYYDHALTEIEKGKLLDLISRETRKTDQEAKGFTTTGDAPEPSSALSGYKDKRLISLLQGNSSKVVDENGEPLVVYHGTDADFTVFDPSKGRANMDIQGMFFSPWSEDVGEYGSNVRPFFLNLRNPAPEERGHAALKKFQGQNEAGVKARESLREEGFDGVDNSGEEYIAFDPSQAKLADGNVGTFDAEDDDIRFRFKDNSGYAQRENGEREATFAALRKMKDTLERLAKILNLDNVEIITSASGTTGRKARAKGYFNRKTGKITIVLPNNRDINDAIQTLLHEAVAHYGLRQLFGDNFDAFLDDVFSNAGEEIRSKIANMAAKNGWDFRKATEEYLAHLAETTNFDKGSSLWQKVKSFFARMLSKMLSKLGVRNLTLDDNDLRYILWRSYENLREKKDDSPFAQASDTAMQYTLNVGEYAKGDELYRDGDPEIHRETLARDRYEQRLRSGMYQSQEALQDSMLGLKEAMLAVIGKDKHLEDIPGFENAYLGENRLSSVNKAEADAFAQTVFRPLLDEVARLAKTQAQRIELNDYMMAKHGLERNRLMAQRDAEASFKAYQEKHPHGTKTYDDFLADFRKRDYAGLTALTGDKDTEQAEADAAIMVDEYEFHNDATTLWKKIKQTSTAILSKLYECGLMNKETFDSISGMYDYYIPLRGFDQKTSAEAYAYLNSRDSAFNAPVKKAHGRTSKADDPFANLQSMAESAIMQGNRNKLVKQRFLNFVLNHPSDLYCVSELWIAYDEIAKEWKPVFPDNIDANDTADEVERKMMEFEQRMGSLANAEPDKYKKGKDAESIPYKVVEKTDLHQHQVVVKRNGRDYVITINGNPRAAQAVNGQTNPDNDLSGAIGVILGAVQKINRQLSAFYTTRNPDFIVSNFVRDALYSNCMTWVKESPAYALRFHRNYLRTNPAQMKILFSKLRNGRLDMSDSLESMFHQFIMNGGETGYTNVRDIEQHKNDISKELSRASSAKISIAKAWDLLADRLDEMNRAVETCARFAAFVTSREMGRSMDRSIYDAKEVSVNFNKKGSGSKFYGAKGMTLPGNISAFTSGLGRSFIVFWNAAVQGTANFGRATKRHPAKALTGMASLFLLGAITAYLGGDGDDDDDDKNSYYNLPEYVRRSNILFRAGENWISIPLPIEFRAFYGMGELAMSTVTGKEHLTNTELAEAMASQLSQVLPVDVLEGGGGASAFIPSSVKPIAEAYIMNRSWTGMPIYKDNDFNKYMPEWTKAYKSANKYIVGMAAALNEVSGGDPYTKGTIDINPAKVEYLLNGYFGGMFSTVDKLTKTAETIFGDRDYDPRNILLVNRLVKSGDERTEYRAINNEYFRLKEEHDILKSRIKSYENDTDNGVFDYAEKLDFLYNSPEYERFEIFEIYRPYIDSLNKELKEANAAGDDEWIKEVESEMYELKKELISEANTTRKRR